MKWYLKIIAIKKDETKSFGLLLKHLEEKPQKDSIDFINFWYIMKNDFENQNFAALVALMA